MTGTSRVFRVLAAATLAVLFSLCSAAVLKAAPPSVIATDGASAFSYQDLADSGPKLEGGYVEFEDVLPGGQHGYTTNPHGGYDTTTNKCKMCHAVHRAEGAYYLLRADRAGDVCDYCHIGGTAHSSKVVYDLNPDGKATTNGHTIGASSCIPDSTTYQWTVDLTLETITCDSGLITETVKVRAYDPQKAQMYRFSRHHSQSAVGTGRSGFLKVGPLSLSCQNCHHVHNATEMVWTTERVYDWFGISTGPAEPYKLLKAYPSGTTTGPANTYGYYDAPQAVRVPETTLTAGVNFSTNRGMEFTVASTGRAAPNWVAQDFAGGRDIQPTPMVDMPWYGSWEICLECHGDIWGAGVQDILFDVDSQVQRPSAVNNTALSVWCADCHNLNIGYYTKLENIELGFRAHSERTHPVPMVGAHEGPGQCYTCHRNDLSPQPSACGVCHYGTGDYYHERIEPTADHIDSDFPHSGDTESIKLLGSYSITGYTGLYTPSIDESATITEDNLDAVCLRCHPGVGVHQ